MNQLGACLLHWLVLVLDACYPVPVQVRSTLPGSGCGAPAGVGMAVPLPQPAPALARRRQHPMRFSLNSSCHGLLLYMLYAKNYVCLHIQVNKKTLEKRGQKAISPLCLSVPLSKKENIVFACSQFLLNYDQLYSLKVPRMQLSFSRPERVRGLKKLACFGCSLL